MELRATFDAIGKVSGVWLALFLARNIKLLSAEIDTCVEAFKSLPEYATNLALVEDKRIAVTSTLGKMKFKTDEERTNYINTKTIEQIQATEEHKAFLAKDAEFQAKEITLELFTIKELELPKEVTAQQLYPFLELIAE